MAAADGTRPALTLAGVHPDAFVHPKAWVSESVIGEGTKVWQFASIIRGAVIGRDCSIASGACIDGSEIGDECVVAHNLAMGPGFKLCDRVFVGPNVTFCNDGWPRAGKSGFDVNAYCTGRYAVLVEDGASIGANSVILPGVRIGKGAMIAAGSVVSKDVPSGHIWFKHGEIRLIQGEDRKERVRFAA